MVKDDEVTKLLKQYGDVFEQIENEKVDWSIFIPWFQ